MLHKLTRKRSVSVVPKAAVSTVAAEPASKEENQPSGVTDHTHDPDHDPMILGLVHGVIHGP